MIVAGSVIEKSMGFPIHFNSNFKHPEISSLGSYSNVRKKSLANEKGQPLALCWRHFAFSPGLVLETAVCKRANGVAWFSCVGASLNPAGG